MKRFDFRNEFKNYQKRFDASLETTRNDVLRIKKLPGAIWYEIRDHQKQFDTGSETTRIDLIQANYHKRFDTSLETTRNNSMQVSKLPETI